MQYKNIHRIEKIKNIQEPRVKKYTFSRTIQDQIKFKNIQEFQGPVTTLIIILFYWEKVKNSLTTEFFFLRNSAGTTRQLEKNILFTVLNNIQKVCNWCHFALMPMICI